MPTAMLVALVTVKEVAPPAGALVSVVSTDRAWLVIRRLVMRRLFCSVSLALLAAAPTLRNSRKAAPLRPVEKGMQTDPDAVAEMVHGELWKVQAASTGEPAVLHRGRQRRRRSLALSLRQDLLFERSGGGNLRIAREVVLDRVDQRLCLIARLLPEHLPEVRAPEGQLPLLSLAHERERDAVRVRLVLDDLDDQLVAVAELLGFFPHDRHRA